MWVKKNGTVRASRGVLGHEELVMWLGSSCLIWIRRRCDAISMSSVAKLYYDILPDENNAEKMTMKFRMIESNNNITCWLIAIMLVFASALLITISANAQTTTEQMSCNQVIATYERNGRVYVRQRTGQVLPVYVGVPISQRWRLICEWDELVTGYSVKSKDKRRCVAMYYCR